MKRILVMLSMIALLGTQPAFCADNYNVYTPSTYKQISIVQSPMRSTVRGEAYELLVDFSGSIQPWIEVAINTLEYILPNIPKTSAVALRVFGDMANPATFTNHCTSTRLVAYFKRDNQANIIKGLSEAKVGGMTPLEYALRTTVENDFRGLKVFSSKAGKNKKIILVTDGSDTCNGDPCAYIRQLVKTRRDIVIDVVQLGNDTSLRCLTDATGGTFHKIDDITEFEHAFEQAFNVPKGTVDAGKKGIELPPQKTETTAVPAQQTQVQVEPKQKRGLKFVQF